MGIDAACRDAHLFTEYNTDLYREIKGQRPLFMAKETSFCYNWAS